MSIFKNAELTQSRINSKLGLLCMYTVRRSTCMATGGLKSLVGRVIVILYSPGYTGNDLIVMGECPTWVQTQFSY